MPGCAIDNSAFNSGKGEDQVDNSLSWNEQLRNERERRHWSQEKLAELMKVDPKTVGRWERGEALPSFSSRERLCELYKKNPEELGLPLRSTKINNLSGSMELFITLLEEFRIERGMSTKTLARSAGLTPGYVSLLIRRGRAAPSVQTVIALAEALELSGEKRAQFFRAAGYSYLISSSSTDIFSERASSHRNEEGQAGISQQEDRSAVPRQQAFYGREKELEQLQKLLVENDAVRCLTIIGLGGIGKTSIAIKLVGQVKDKFEYVHWYSLQNALPEETISKILEDCLRSFSEELTDDVNSQLDRFIDCLEKHRCLIILDNFESLLKSGQLVGQYETGYEEFGRLLDLVGSKLHHSCLVLTSREKPAEIAHLEGKAVRSFLLSGVEYEDGRKILRDKGLIVGNDAWKRLVQLYSGNPLALQLVSTPIRDVFGGDIATFLKSLQDEEVVVSVIHDLLNKQFQRLSEVEKEVMYWLAIEREEIETQKLREDILQIASKLELLAVLESLLRRSLIERNDVAKFGLQPFVMEYVTNRLVDGVYKEIEQQQIVLLENHALIKAETEDYIRKGQMRFILEPLKERLLATYHQEEIERKLKDLLVALRKEGLQKSGYAAGNILNLLIYLSYDLHGYNFSFLTVRQAYLREKGLPNVDFAHANLYGSVFTDTFGCVLSVALSLDGKLLVAGTVNNEVRIWLREKRTLLHTCQGHTDWVRSVAFSPDGRILASGSHDQTIRLWDVDTGQCIGKFTGHKSRVRAVTFSPIEEKLLLASSSDDMTIRIWDVKKGQSRRPLEGHQGKVNAIAFSPDGQTLASVSHDETIRIWDVDGGYLRKELCGEGGWIWSVAFSHDGNTLASGNEDGTITLWNMRTNLRHQTLRGHRSRVNTVTFSPRRDILVSGSDDKTVRVWNVSTGRVQQLTGHSNWVRSVAVSYDGAVLVSGSDDETVRIWDTDTKECQYTLQGYSGWVHSVAFSSNARPLLVNGGEDMRVRIWDAKTGELLESLHGHTHRVRSVAFSPDNSKIASASDDQTVRIWEVETGICLRILHGHKHRVRAVTFSPDNSKIASASDDQTVRIWEVETGMCLQTFKEHKSRVYSVTWSYDGNLLASSSEDRKICLWDMHTNQLLRVFPGHEGRVYAVAFSPDNSFLISGSDDLTVRLWEVATGTCIRVMTGHSKRICSVAYSPDGQMIASASDDRTVRLWNTGTGEIIRTITGHSGRVCSVAFFENTHIATGSYDGTIRLWNLQTGEQENIFRSERPYEGMNITDVRGLTSAQKSVLKALGAVEIAEK